MRGSSRVGWFIVVCDTQKPSFQGAHLCANPESRYLRRCLMDSGFGAAHRPGMTKVDQFVFEVRAFFTTMPPFITNFTRSISERSATGFPDTAMMSANLPFSMLTMSFSQSSLSMRGERL